mgnify:CR=1 FL=1
MCFLSKNLFKFFIFFTFICFGQEKKKEYKYYPTTKKNSIKKYKLEKGRKTHEFTLDNNKKWKIRLSVPELKKDKNVPLIIALHWAGKKDTFQEYSDCLAFPSFESLNGIIVTPSGDGFHWIHEKNERRVIKLIKQIIKYWPVDKNKIIITGYSNGAIGSWYYSQKYQNLFAAAIPVAGFYKKSSKIKVPMYILHGEKDELFNSELVETSIKKSIEKKSKITYKILTDYSHFMGCSYTEELKKMALLMQKEVLK